MIEIKQRITGEVLYRRKGIPIGGLQLQGMNLENGVFRNMDLFHTDFTGANLNGADFSFANLQTAKFCDVTAVGANLTSAIMSFADLTGADVRMSSCGNTIFNMTRFAGANLSGALFSNTVLAFCFDFVEALNIDEIKHFGPSAIDSHTFAHCVDDLSDHFLEQCGYTPHDLGYLRSLYGGDKAIQFYSCFISHAEANEDFANRLRDDFRAKNVTCWHYKHDLKGGELFDPQIDTAIKRHEKLILVCSEAALFRPAVIKEIIKAIRDEKRTGKKKLFPVRLDNFVFGVDAADKFYDLKPHEQGEDWLEYIRKHWVGDFTKWKSHDDYQTAFSKLLGDLRASDAGAQPAP